LNSHFHSEGAAYWQGISDSFGNLLLSQTDNCGGQASLIRLPASTPPGKIAIPIIPLTSVVPAGRAVLILKIDTEGHEYGVLKGALPLFQSHQILNAFVEVTPCCHFWDRIGVSKAQVSGIFGTIASYGYGMWVLGESQPTSRYYNSKPVLLESAKAIQDYMQNADFMQQDMWLYSQVVSPLSSKFQGL
jgi:hypothetical protein